MIRIFISSFISTVGIVSSSILRAEVTQLTGNPNIVLILADDFGFGDVACYNPKSKVPTPRIDRLAREGLRFTDAHSSSTVCTPTRYSILTGRMADWACVNLTRIRGW